MEFFREIWVMQSLSHPNILPLFGVSVLPPAIILEYMSGGNLYDELRDPSRICFEKLLTDFVSQMSLDLSNYDLNPAVCEFAPSLLTIGHPNECWLNLLKGKVSLERMISRASEDALEEFKSSWSDFERYVSAYITEPSRTSAKFIQIERAMSQLLENHDKMAFLGPMMEWPLRMKIAADIGDGLHYLHHLSPPIIHQDIKSPNILLTQTGQHWLSTFTQTSPNSLSTFLVEPLAKIADFGFSFELCVVSRQTQVDLNPIWTSPERLALRGVVCQASDIYSR